jgi:magnesium chelatase accessory protein
VSERLVWERDGLDWPHREASEFLEASGLRWHVQRFGSHTGAKPVAVLLHGTGASTHSWRGLAPLLTPYFDVMAMDLPGHGFTAMPSGGATSQQLSLSGMARAIHGLLEALKSRPAVMVGHSAGAAIAVRMCLDGYIAPQSILGLNGAFLPLGGMAGQLFSPVARLMAATAFVPKIFSWRASDPQVLKKLVDATGSRIDEAGMALYGKLVSNPGHAAGALGMMANWDLATLLKDVQRLRTRLSLVVGANDLTISPREANRLIRLLPAAAAATLEVLPGLGHLAHEERPDLVAEIVLKQCVPGYRSDSSFSHE